MFGSTSAPKAKRKANTKPSKGKAKAAKAKPRLAKVKARAKVKAIATMEKPAKEGGPKKAAPKAVLKKPAGAPLQHANW